MELSIFLAKLFGLYSLIVALILLARGDRFEQAINSFMSSQGLIVFSGFIALAAGLAMAISHSIWEWSFRGVITIIGYLLILQAIVRISFPQKLQDLWREIYPKFHWWMFAIWIILGAYLTYYGFR